MYIERKNSYEINNIGINVFKNKLKYIYNKMMNEKIYSK